jgi:hypothetical protein
LQADKKTLTVKPSHPDRNKQFEYINLRVPSSQVENSKYDNNHAAPGKSESSCDSILERIICSMGKYSCL